MKREAIIHLLNQYERKYTVTKTFSRWDSSSRSNQPYSIVKDNLHKYTIAVFQENQSFFAAMYSTNNTYGSWRYEQTFDNLSDAMELAHEMIRKPHEYGAKNLNQNAIKDWSTTEDDQAVIGLSQYERPASLDDGSLADRVSRGREIFTINLTGGELIRQLWTRRSQTARAALVQYAREAPFTYGYWTHWKWLYKQAEGRQKIEPTLITALLARLDQVDFTQVYSPILTEQEPSYKTIGYMKRRGRRFLRFLAEQHPEQYLEIATGVLERAGEFRTELDASYQWLAFDIVNTGRDQYYLGRHGRGPYVRVAKLPQRKLHSTILSTLWVQRPDLVLPLYKNEKMAWQVLEFAMLVLRTAKTPATHSYFKPNSNLF